MYNEKTVKAVKSIDLVSKKIEILEKKKMGIEKQTIATVRKMEKAKNEKEMQKLRGDCLKSDQSREKVEKEIEKLNMQRSKILEKELK